ACRGNVVPLRGLGVSAELVRRARDVQKNAYCPYSKFRVGAALEAADGRVFVGANVESASYGLTICAERMAIGAAIADGARGFSRIVVAPHVGPPASPRGACRQLLAQCALDLQVIARARRPLPRSGVRDPLPDATDTLDSRPIFRIKGVGRGFVLSTTDTGAILGADSARLQVRIVRRDTATHNLWLHLYRLPITIDTSTTFGSVVPFTDSLRSVNVDTLLAQPGGKDPVTGDSLVVDTVNHHLVLSLKLDATSARYVGTHSGTGASGIRIAADTLASIAFGK